MVELSGDTLKSRSVEVLLQRDVEHIGRSGEVVRVDDDLALRYLLPGRHAVATSQIEHIPPGDLEPKPTLDQDRPVDTMSMLGLAQNVQTPEDPMEALVRRAAEVFGNNDAAREWIGEKIPSLGGKRPLDMFSGSDQDRERVLAILGRIEAGVF
jgi:Protein of unknown function (DUF2384)/Ribosomal protein L9, N-terminal domain